MNNPTSRALSNKIEQIDAQFLASEFLGQPMYNKNKNIVAFLYKF